MVVIKNQLVFANFEDGKELQDKEWRWFLEARKGKESDTPMVTPEKKQPQRYLDFSPLRSTLDF